MKTEPTEEMREIIEHLFDFTDADKAQIDMFQKIKHEIAITAFKKGQSSPKIKQLEWENHGSSITAVGISDYEYCINLKDDHTTLSLRNNYQIIVLGTYSRPDEAKAAAQADFEKRVMECLDL